MIPSILCITILIIKIFKIITNQKLKALFIVCKVWLTFIYKIYWNKIWIIKRYISKIALIILNHFIISRINCSFIGIPKNIIPNILEICTHLRSWAGTIIGTHYFFYHYIILVIVSYSSIYLLNICIWNRLVFYLIIARNILPCLNIWRYTNFYRKWH